MAAIPLRLRGSQAEPTGLRMARALLFSSLFALILLPEYVQGLGDPASKSQLYLPLAGNFRAIDIAILLLCAMHVFALGCSRRRSSHFPLRLLLLAGGFAIAIAVSFFYGAHHGGHNLFFDWRALALGAALYPVYRFWIQNSAGARDAVVIFGGFMAVAIIVVLARYVAGRGATLLGIHIPAFDGPTLSAMVCAALFGLCLSEAASGWSHGWLWLLLSAAAGIVVALSFRRTYWAELGIGIAILTVVRRRQRVRNLLLLAAVVLVAAATLGPALLTRIESLDVTRWDSQYGQDNADHVGDVLDAWDQVRASPLMGVGLGRSYPTWRIRNWKEQSVMVHNAPLHVWLKYGLLGLAFYLAYHVSLLGWLRRRSRGLPAANSAVVTAILAYLAAQFMVTLGFAPWPYSALQSTNLIAFLLALAFVQDPSCPCQIFRSSPLHSTAPTTWKTQYSA